MIINGRRVLDDCKGALKELDNTYGDIWRRRYIMIVVLLRTVGHVLHKIDSKSDECHKNVIDEWWKSIKKNKESHDIFFKFIEAERNSILKEYAINAGQSATVHFSWNNDSHVEYSYPMYGDYDGNDQRAVITEAIEWWEEQITLIERKIKNCSSIKET